jgi:divalent metal cation (Fe/Co/Zn/Cd) transporter
MSELVQLGAEAVASRERQSQRPHSQKQVILWLQGVTIAWMLVECGVALYAAAAAHSPAMLAFGSDSLVELLSASVVSLQFVPGIALSDRKAGRAASILLFLLAGVVVVSAFAALLLHLHPEVSLPGMAITVAALIAMPLLALLKRREARRTGSVALAADAVQSATCAWLALTTLAGLLAHATLHIPWADSVAALIAVPFLVKEARAAWKGQPCACC